MSVPKDILMYGTSAAKPAAASTNDGKLYRETDTGKTYHSNGSSWVLVADSGAIVNIVSDWKESCRVATTANITLSGTQTIDGVSVIANDRVLVKDQTSGSENGIYVCAAGAWSRATDADTDAEVTANLAVYIEAGSTNGDKLFILTTNNPITVGSTSLSFVALSAGTGVSRSGSTTDNNLAVWNGTSADSIKDGGSFLSNLWSQVVNESGTSFANWTGAAGGTWSSDGTVIKQTEVSANRRRAKYNTKIVTAFSIMEAEVQLRTSGGDNRGGFIIGYDGSTGTSGFAVYIDENNTVVVEVDAVAARYTYSVTINVNTWYKLRAICTGNMASVYLDGTLIFSVGNDPQASSNADFIGLLSYNSEVWWRNIKAWNLVMPA